MRENRRHYRVQMSTFSATRDASSLISKNRQLNVAFLMSLLAARAWNRSRLERFLAGSS